MAKNKYRQQPPKTAPRHTVQQPSENQQITISIEELRKRKIIVATPMYGGQCHGFYTRACTELQRVADQHGVSVRFLFLFNESLITRARNYCVDEFLRSDGTHLMFIDSDIGFNPNDVLTMAGLMSEDSEYDILCGPYPKKTIAWEKIKAAVDAGLADDDPQQLQRFVGDYVFNLADGTTSFHLGQPVEVREGGTGFMMIRRETFEKYAEAYPELSYKPDHVRTQNFDGSREIHAYFETVIDSSDFDLGARIKNYLMENDTPDVDEIQKIVDEVKNNEYSKRYLSEDYMFCQWARKAGLKVWMCPWMQTTHTGSYTFGGSLADLAQIGASFTASKKVSPNSKK